MATRDERPHGGTRGMAPLLFLAVGLLVVNLAVLCVLYLLPMPDPSTLPGRTPAHDVQPATP
jgi:hypothetical protein